MIMKRLIHQEDKTDLIWMYLIIDSKELKLSQLNDKETQSQDNPPLRKQVRLTANRCAGDFSSTTGTFELIHI